MLYYKGIQICVASVEKQQPYKRQVACVQSVCMVSLYRAYSVVVNCFIIAVLIDLLKKSRKRHQINASTKLCCNW